MIEMKRSTPARRWALGCLLVVAAVSAQSAQAEQLLLSASATISGTQSAVYSLTAPSAGVVTVSLGNYDWPERLGSLSFALATSTGVLKTLSGEGSTTVDLSSAGNYYALVTGTAQGRWNLGMYSLKLTFSPLGGPAPVPVPAALWLLLSGLAGMWGWARKRAPALAPALAPAH